MRFLLRVSIGFFAVSVCLLGCSDNDSSNKNENDNTVSMCGNGVQEAGENCDGTDLGPATCESLGFSGGTLSCTDDCVYDSHGCTSPALCGNGMVEHPETCDGSDLAETTCVDLGFSGGVLGCLSDCSDFDTAGCFTGACGDGNLDSEAGEECDDGNTVDGDGCSSTCQIEPPLIGPRPVESTPEGEATLIAAPDGTGTACILSEPCDLWEVVDQAAAGDVVFLRGGTYDIDENVRFYNSGFSDSPILFESYPGEHAILDGSSVDVGESITIQIVGNFNWIRLIEITNMPREGIVIRGNNNLLEGVHVHHAHLSGIHIHYSYDLPYGEGGSYNILRDSVSNDNFDEGTSHPGFANGGNADGISISSGIENSVEHCLVYQNSDDGIDTWRSTDTYIGYSIAHTQGLADGNANGIKAGGQPPAAGTLVEHCIAYGNLSNGIDYNSGESVTFLFNTTFQNSGYGFVLGSDTSAEYNIASADGGGDVTSGGIQEENSWQREGTVEFVSEDPASPDFLKPTSGGGFEDIGAYGGL